MWHIKRDIGAVKYLTMTETLPTLDHAEILAALPTKKEQIDYAVRTLNGSTSANVMQWLSDHGIRVSRSMVSPAVNKYLAATNNPDMGTVIDFAPHPDHHHQPPCAEHTSPAAPAAPAAPATPDTTTPDLPAPGPPLASPPVAALAPPNWVSAAFYAAALLGLTISLNTSWRFFDQVLAIPVAERVLMFAAAEFALIVCGAAMAVSVRHTGRPAPGPKMIVWAMCAVAAYMAVAEAASTAEAIGRILLGPALATIMLHLGLGLDIRLRRHRAPNRTAARIWTEIRERALSRLGLADDERSAAQRTRDRKALKAAALSRPRRAPWSRPARLERAVLSAGIADDPALRHRMLARVAACQNAHRLGELAQTTALQYR